MVMMVMIDDIGKYNNREGDDEGDDNNTSYCINIFPNLMLMMLYSLAMPIAMYATVTLDLFLAIGTAASPTPAAPHR